MNANFVNRFLTWLAVKLIRGYQVFISPMTGAHCRFYPTCSQYALTVFNEWGFFKGAWLTLKRLLKCGPWNEGGYDPPPLKIKTKLLKKHPSGLSGHLP